jgi:hypothetical protein
MQRTQAAPEAHPNKEGPALRNLVLCAPTEPVRSDPLQQRGYGAAWVCTGLARLEPPPSGGPGPGAAAVAAITKRDLPLRRYPGGWSWTPARESRPEKIGKVAA